MLRINEIAAKLDLPADAVEPYGWHRAKFTLAYLAKLPPPKANAKYIDVTAVSPTPFGEGKTVTSIALSMGFWQIGRSSIATLRQPSMAPVFGIKGGGVGGGRSSLVPPDEMNLHFTGDIHAVSAANNLLAALIDNHVKRKQLPELDPSTITWRRAVDISDKALSRITAGLNDGLGGPKRETGFDLTAASEVMAILALAESFEDLKQRLDQIRVGLTPLGAPITALDLKASGAMAAILRDAFRPNLVQTIEGTPALLHTGPFANIAHGNSSVIADRVALGLSEFVVTESGFGSDCGAEKFFHLKCRPTGLKPDVAVLVCTVRALKWHSGKFGSKLSKTTLPATITEVDIPAIKKGASNLLGHIALLQRFGVPIVVAINRFPSDTEQEIETIKELALNAGVNGVEVSTGFEEGGKGAVALATTVAKVSQLKSEIKFLYEPNDSIEQKLENLARLAYGAAGLELSPQARASMERLSRDGYGHLPLCIAKTQYSFSHDPALLGRPTDFTFPIRELGVYAGARFLYALAGDMLTMPGLPAKPAAWNVTVDNEGNISGLK